MVIILNKDLIYPMDDELDKETQQDSFSCRDLTPDRVH